MNNNNTSSGAIGVGFCDLLGLVFIVLKLCGVIDWSWWWVLAPIWIPLALFLVIVIGMIIIVALKER